MPSENKKTPNDWAQMCPTHLWRWFGRAVEQLIATRRATDLPTVGYEYTTVKVAMRKVPRQKVHITRSRLLYEVRDYTLYPPLFLQTQHITFEFLFFNFEAYLKQYPISNQFVFHIEQMFYIYDILFALQPFYTRFCTTCLARSWLAATAF